MDALVIGCSQTKTFVWIGHGCIGHQTQSKMNVMMVSAWMLWSLDAVEHEYYHGLDMDALVITCSQTNKNVLMIWAWMLWSSDAVEKERYNGLGMDALVIGCSQTKTFVWIGHGCIGHQTQSKMNVMMVSAWMLWSLDAVEHEYYHGLDMDALVITCSQTNKNVLMIWAWMLWSSDAVEKNITMVWAWMPWSSDTVEHERYYGLGAREYTRGCCVTPPVTTIT